MQIVENCQELLTERFLNKSKEIALDAKLLVYLIENKILSLSSWQNKFVTYIKSTIETINDLDIIDFIEMFVVRGIIDRDCIKEEQVSGLLGCVESFAKSKESSFSLRWKGISMLLNLADFSSDVYDHLAKIYFEQWVKNSGSLAMEENF